MTIPDLVADLAATPRPVVCLDTCVLLDLLRAGWREPIDQITGAGQLSAAAEDDPPRAAVVVSYLVPIEFDQNLPEVRREAAAAVVRLERLVGAAALLGRSPPSPALSTPPTLVDGLTDAARRLLSAARSIDREPACVARAVDRVVTKTKPAANGRVKDAIHLEHYLELSRAMDAAGLPCLRAFVSSNKADFDDPGLAAADFGPAGLPYFPRLEAALGALRL